MKRIILTSLFICTSIFVFAQNYQFTNVKDLEATSVKNQGYTGTCWSFSTSSFLESEIERITGKDIEISEMYSVRNTYDKKAWNYIMRQGHAQFGEGGLAHDVINSVKDFGMVPESVFTGLLKSQKQYNHAEMIAVLKSMLKTYIKNPGKKLSPNWKKSVDAILDEYIGKNPKTFMYKGKEYTPKSFAKMTKINTSNYITLTSFTQQPFYSSFILNIPDNFSNGSFYNLPLNEYTNVVNYAINHGYTVALDVDVSEPTFSAKYGVAVEPKYKAENKKSLTNIVDELTINQTYRQQEFENYDTTDDHLMHITGLIKDQNGKVYYKVKNSWGTSLANGGYIYMSPAYFKLKSISILLNKDALPKNIKEKLHLKS